MRIAQVAPLAEAVPPRMYGGTERVVHYLTENLVAMGHDVTLFASGDSRTSARLVPCWPTALRLAEHCPDPVLTHILQMEMLDAQADRFDIIHFHTDALHFPFARRCPVPSVVTLHGRQDIPCLRQLYREYNDVPLVSISDYQRKPVPWANWAKTIHHGLPLDLLTGTKKPGHYLAFLGRFSPEKRFDRAVEIARLSGIPLKAAAKADPSDEIYFQEVIRPLLADPLVEWVGEIGESAKGDFLGGALAHLFPVDWPEPFGLVMIEAMACGTPTIAWPCGSVPEVIDDGLTGFIVNSIDEAVAAIASCADFDRRICRQVFEHSFSARRMALDYLSLYHSLAAIRRPDRAAIRRPAAKLLPDQGHSATGGL